MKVKIYGYGWVGKAMKTLFPDASVQDPGLGMIDDFPCDIAFICVPTPLKNGKLDTSIVESIVANCEEPLIVIRSTVNPGTTEELSLKYGKRIIFQPEYLGETVGHPMNNQHARQFIIMGGEPEDCRKLIELYQTVYNADVTIRQVTDYEAEVIKMTANRAAAFKVAQCQELYDACQKSGIDYNIIREAVYGDDPRHNLLWTFVFPENRGFNSSKCLVKDVPAWCAWAESCGANADVTRLLVQKSNEYMKT